MECKRERVMDDESGDDDRDELRSGWGGESREEWWGWRNESGSWFQRRGDAYLNERSVIFKEEMVGGRERVTTECRWRAGTARRLKRDKVACQKRRRVLILSQNYTWASNSPNRPTYGVPLNTFTCLLTYYNVVSTSKESESSIDIKQIHWSTNKSAGNEGQAEMTDV